jgi:hypothetical protein
VGAAWSDLEMPLLRYFLFVGGALLALLFISDAVLPQVPLPSTLNSGSDLPAVRIRSDRKWPERVVFDTSAPMVSAVTLAKAAAPVEPTLAEASAAKARVRAAFAQLPPGKADAKVESQPSPSKTVAMAASEPSVPQPNKMEPKLKRKVAKARPPGRPVMLVAQQPHFGMFDNTW